MNSPQHLPHKHILLIDDSFPTREMISMVLGGVGYRVSTAANGEEAMQRLRSTDRTDLILLDLSMPVMDGWAFHRRLQGDPELCVIPVVVLTGADGNSPEVETLTVACRLQKPVETAELLQTVQKCCR